MKLVDLDYREVMGLRFLKHHQDFKFEELGKRIMNTLASYGLVEYIGNLQYELTVNGLEILNEYYTQTKLSVC